MHGGQQEYGIHYWETSAPVVTWQTLRVFMILSLIHGWASHQLDFVVAYPQAPAEKPLYQPMFWIVLCKVANDFPNGHQGPDLEYTLVHPQIMQDQWY